MQGESNLFHLTDRDARRPATRGWVYFVGERGHVDFHVKIGWTNGRPYARIAALQSGNPRELELLGYLSGTEADERAIHELFASERVRGEWFVPSPALSEFIRCHTRKTNAEWRERPARRPLWLSGETTTAGKNRREDA